MTREELIPALERILLEQRRGHYEGAEIRFSCPSHDDEHPSARWNRKKNDGVWRCDVCQAGGGYVDLARRLGMVSGPERREKRKAESRRVLCAYDYRDEEGTVLFQVVRYEPKGFAQRRPHEKGYSYELNGVRRVLYRLPELLAADPALPVYVVEGEKDTDALAALGLVATTNPGGARKWKPEYAEPLRGHDVVLLPDHDVAGRDHAEMVARNLASVARTVRIVELPGLPEKGDVSDWLAAGGTCEELQRLIALRSEPGSRNERSHGTAGARPGSEDAPDSPSELPYVCLADVQPEVVQWLWAARVPRGKVTVLEGDPDLGKSTLLLDLGARVSTGRAMPLEHAPTLPACGVVVVTAEDGLGDTVRPRLEAAGADLTRIVAFRMEALPNIPGDLGQIEKAIAAVDAAFVILDPFVAFLPGAVNSWRDQDVRRAMSPLAALAERTHTAVVVIRHLTKGGDDKAIYRGGGSIGIAGAARSVLLVAPDPDDPERRILARVKGNLAPPCSALAYALVPEGASVRVDWKGETQHTASDLLTRPEADEDKSAVADAITVLASLLGAGRVEADVVERERRKTGISHWAWRQAKRRLGVKSSLEGFGRDGKWFWSLATRDDATRRPSSLDRSGHCSPLNPAKNARDDGPENTTDTIISADASPYGGRPPAVCRTCGGGEFHRAGDGWTCSRCHPAPGCGADG